MNLKLQRSKILKELVDLPPKSLRVDGIIDYYNARLVLEGYK